MNASLFYPVFPCLVLVDSLDYIGLAEYAYFHAFRPAHGSFAADGCCDWDWEGVLWCPYGLLWAYPPGPDGYAPPLDGG